MVQPAGPKNQLQPAYRTFNRLTLLSGRFTAGWRRLRGYPPTGQTISASTSAWATSTLPLLRQTNVDYKVSLRLRGQDGHGRRAK